MSYFKQNVIEKLAGMWPPPGMPLSLVGGKRMPPGKDSATAFYEFLEGLKRREAAEKGKLKQVGDTLKPVGNKPKPTARQVALNLQVRALAERGRKALSERPTVVP